MAIDFSKAARIKFYSKTADCFNGEFLDQEGATLFEIDGYPPSFLGDGDGIELEIDLKTGQIIGWEPPLAEDLDEEYAEQAADYEEAEAEEKKRKEYRALPPANRVADMKNSKAKELAEVLLKQIKPKTEG